MDQRVLNDPIRVESGLVYQGMDLPSEAGAAGSDAGSEDEGEGEVVRRGVAAAVHREEEREGEVGLGGLGVGSDQGVVEVGVVWFVSKGIEDKSGVVDVAGEGREGEETAEVSGGARIRRVFEDPGVELHRLAHSGDLHCNLLESVCLGVWLERERERVCVLR